MRMEVPSTSRSPSVKPSEPSSVRPSIESNIRDALRLGILDGEANSTGEREFGTTS